MVVEVPSNGKKGTSAGIKSERKSFRTTLVGSDGHSELTLLVPR